jgi:hypothetical protein
MVTSISKIIFNQFLLKGSFLPFSFSVQNFLFHGYVRGSMIIIYKTDIQYMFANSKSNWWDSFAAKSKISKLAVTEWLQKHQIALPSLIIILNQKF